jgi:hypothetical protein
MSLLALLAVSVITFSGQIVVPTDEAQPVVTTTMVQDSTVPLLSYVSTDGSVTVETRVYP